MKRFAALLVALLFVATNAFAITQAESLILRALNEIRDAQSNGTIIAGGTNATGAPNGATAQVVALSNGTAHLDSRATRRRVAIQNSSATEKIYYGFSSGVTAANGFHLDPGLSQSIAYSGALYFYSASGTAVVECVESYDG